MLYTLAVLLLIAWLLGVVGTYTIGAFVHVLLVIAIVLFLVGLISGPETVVQLLRRGPARRRGPHPIFVGRLGTEQVLYEVVPPPPDHVRLVPDAVAAVRQH